MTGTATTPETWGSYWDYFGLRLVEIVGVTRGARVLDIGTGGGASLYPAARIVGDHGEVIGIETCHHCQERTSSEINRCGVTNAKVLLMDAENMTFAHGSFDFVIAGFIGWDECYDFESCEFKKRDRKLEEILRVLKPGGRVGFTGWVSQEDGDWMKELVRRYLPSDSFSEGNRPSVPDAFSKETSKGWHKLLSSLGLKEVRVSEETAEFTYRDEDEWLNSFLPRDAWKNHIEKIEKAGLLDSLRSEASSLLQRYSEGIHFRRNVVFALGTK